MANQYGTKLVFPNFAVDFAVAFAGKHTHHTHAYHIPPLAFAASQPQLPAGYEEVIFEFVDGDWLSLSGPGFDHLKPTHSAEPNTVVFVPVKRD